MLSKENKAKIKRAIRAYNAYKEAEMIANVKRELAIYDPCIVVVKDGDIWRYNSWREAYKRNGSIDRFGRFIRYFYSSSLLTEVKPWDARADAIEEAHCADYGMCNHVNEDICQCWHTGNRESIQVHIGYHGHVTIEHVTNEAKR